MPDESVPGGGNAPRRPGLTSEKEIPVDATASSPEGESRFLRPIREHLAAEAARDVELTMRTVTADCRYDFPLQGIMIQGPENLRRYFRALFDSRPGKTLKSDIKKYWISGSDTVVAECEVTFDTAQGPSPTLFIGIFGVRDGLLSSERIYVTDFLDFLSDLGFAAR